MRELDARPLVVRLEIRWTDIYDGGVVGRPGVVECAIEPVGQRCVIKVDILGVAANSDMWLCALKLAEIVQEVVRERVWV